ncbi:uncharacterized protein LOC134276814 [Saccostrea cucullata]|uniref:uncharacterized protein LOC134276814 n=1 Tax=Saccostrea cuccullata TaxID=36930 RepID=UPI002ED10293
MAESHLEEYTLGSPLVPNKMCESHELPIDIICEDCDKFICVHCAKTDHRDHEWKTLTTAATERRRGLQKFLEKIKEEDLPEVDAKMEMILQQIKENKETCDYEIERLHNHCEDIMNKLTEIKKHHEQLLRDNLVKKNDQLNNVKSELEKKRGIVDSVEFMEKNKNTISDYSFIENDRELRKTLSGFDVHMTECEHSVRFIKGEINNDFLDTLIGKTLDFDDISVTQINSFQYGGTAIQVLETIVKDQCYINELNSNYAEKVNQQGTKEQIFSINPNDMYATDNHDNGDVYFTDFSNNSISCLSPSGSVSTVISTDPLQPLGICRSVDGGLLVTLKDKESDDYKLKSHSRRLVRHITATGDVIHEYEYQEDGHTRLFTLPHRVKQNSNSNICIVNCTSAAKGELVIMSPSGRLKSVYRGQSLIKDFDPTDVVCDSLCNILVTDPRNKQLHLLSPDAEFLKFLLIKNEVNRPCRLSLYKSSLWVGYLNGLVKVFRYTV